jgi:hypothetical protein
MPQEYEGLKGKQIQVFRQIGVFLLNRTHLSLKLPPARPHYQQTKMVIVIRRNNYRKRPYYLYRQCQRILAVLFHYNFV